MIKIQSILFIIILTLIVVIIYNKVTPIYKEYSLQITPQEARSRRFGMIIDVRTSKEREELGYYPNSIPMNIDTLQTDISRYVPNKNTSILVYSNGDQRAITGSEILNNIGYHRVYYIKETYNSLMPGY